jgi:hypothetical protein
MKRSHARLPMLRPPVPARGDHTKLYRAGAIQMTSASLS